MVNGFERNELQQDDWTWTYRIKPTENADFISPCRLWHAHLGHL